MNTPDRLAEARPRERSAVAEADAPARFWALAKLSLAVVLTLTTWFSATAVMPQLKQHWHVTAGGAVWLAIAVQLGFIIGALLSAMTSLADRVAPRVLMAAAAAGVGLVNILLLVAGTTGEAIALRVLTGLMLAGVYPPSLKFVATWFRKGRGIALGCVIGALTLGSAAPHAINALGGVGWRGVIVATSLAAFAGAALFLFALREGPYPFPKAGFKPSEVGAALSDRRFLLCTTGYLGHMWELYAMWSWLLFFVTDRLKALGTPSASLASAITFLIIAAGTPACIAAGSVADRFGRPVTTIALLAASGTCAGVIGLVFAAPAWLFLIVGLLWGASVIADSAQFSAIVTESGARFVGTALTVQLGAGFAVTILAILTLPAVAGWAGGWRWVFLALVPGPVIGGLAMAALRRLIARETRQALR